MLFVNLKISLFENEKLRNLSILLRQNLENFVPKNHNCY